jgi:hypothetical protein
VRAGLPGLLIQTDPMCSVSWTRRAGRLVVAMNRDERHDRAPARPPRRWPGGFLAPVDGAAGGTWIAARRDGVVLALLNHHAGGEPAQGEPRVSRGHLVTTLAALPGVPGTGALRACGLPSYAPFRLLVVGRRGGPVVFTWNGRRLTSRRPPSRVGFLTSSSWNSRRVIAARHASFRRFVRAHPSPTRADLIALLTDASDPRGAAWAVCMSRDDARTVSLTVVDVAGAVPKMTYRARPIQSAARVGGTAIATSVWTKSSPLHSSDSAKTLARA